MDSASSIWAHPVPDGITPGDIAVSDPGLGDVSTLATAFVKHGSSGAPSEIDLIVFDEGGEFPRYLDTFSAPELMTGYHDPLCRYPAVEVTYSRNEGVNAGILVVEVIWSQLTNLEAPHWDLYYHQVSFRVFADGIWWFLPMESPIVQIESTASGFDEFQPDLSVHAESGDLYAVFNRRDPTDPTLDKIYAVRHPDWGQVMKWSPLWAMPYKICGSDARPRSAPKVDAGPVELDEGIPVPRVAATWSELYDEHTWQVWYNDWDPGNPGTPSQTAEPVTQYAMYRVNALPQIDITPDSSGIHQAVIAWFHCRWVLTPEPAHYDEFAVWMTATPDIDDFTAIPETSICPDVACYQMSDPDEHWFGLSYYLPAGEEPWLVRAHRFTFSVDWETESVTITPVFSTDVLGSNGRWNLDNPFTGSTLNLRIPDDDDLESSNFGIGWVDKEDGDEFMAYLSAGTID